VYPEAIEIVKAAAGSQTTVDMDEMKDVGTHH
jgi:hypothetical protein